MKKIIYVTSVILFVLSFISIGELFVLHIGNFESSYTYVSFYPGNQTNRQMYNDIYHKAKSNNLKVFAVNREVLGAKNEEITIFSDDSTLRIIEQRSNINIGKISSLFTGNITVNHVDFQQISDEIDLSEFRLIGKSKDMVQFKKELVNQYAGSFPRKSNEKDNSRKNILIIWITVFFFLGLLALFHVLLIRKEILIKVVLGETIQEIVIKNQLIDIGVISLIFTVCLMLTKVVTTSTFCLSVSVVALLFFLLVNTLLYFTLFSINIRLDYSNQTTGKILLKVSYVYKIISLILVLTSLASVFPLIEEGINFWNQRLFFNEMKNSSFIRINPSGIGKALEDQVEKDNSNELTNIYERELYLEKEFISNFSNRMFSLVNISNLIPKKQALIYANKNAFPIIRNTFRNLANNIPNSSKGISLLVPSTTDMSTVQILKEIFTSEYPVKVLYYDEQVKLLNISTLENPTSNYSINPIVIYNADYLMPKAMKNISYVIRSSLFNISDVDWNDYQNKMRPQVDQDLSYKLNSFNWYRSEWVIKKRTLLVAITVCVLAILLEVLMLVFLIVLEIKIKMKQIVLKKILGYNFFERHVSSFLLPIICAILVVFGVVLIFPLLNLKSLHLVFIVLFGFTVAEEIVTGFLVKKFTQKQIIKYSRGSIL